MDEAEYNNKKFHELMANISKMKHENAILRDQNDELKSAIREKKGLLSLVSACVASYGPDEWEDLIDQYLKNKAVNDA